MCQYDIGGGATAIPSLFLSSSFSPIQAVVFASFPAAGTYGLVAQCVERFEHNENVAGSSPAKAACCSLFCVR